MTYQEAEQAALAMESYVAEQSTSSTKPTKKPSKPRGASKATLAARAAMLGLCVSCSRPLNAHDRAQMLECATARS